MSWADLTALSVAEIIGDFGLKDFARSGSMKGFGQGLLGYTGIIYFLIRSLKVGNVLYVNGMWDGISTVLESLAAYFLLGERLKRPIEYAGLAAIILGIFLLHAPEGKIPF